MFCDDICMKFLLFNHISLKQEKGFQTFITMVRENLKTMKLKEAVTKAVDDCIRQGILKEFLIKHKAQVIKMSIYEYDEKKQRQFDMEEGTTLHFIVLVQRKIAKGKTLDAIADELESSVEEIRPVYDVVMKYPTDTYPKTILMNM